MREETVQLESHREHLNAIKVIIEHRLQKLLKEKTRK